MKTISLDHKTVRHRPDALERAGFHRLTEPYCRNREGWMLLRVVEDAERAGRRYVLREVAKDSVEVWQIALPS